MMKFTREHEWLRIEGHTATIGITEHAQDALGDVVFVELPAVGSALDAHAVAGVVESVKAAADVYMPVAGTVIEVNEQLQQDPSLVNQSPLDQGWFFKITIHDLSTLNDLLDLADYQALTQQ